MTGRKPPRVAALLWLLAGALSLSACQPEIIQGQASVIDGDTIVINHRHIRLWGIDAPELEQTCTLVKLDWPCGELARQVMASLVKGETVTCARVDTDKYKRIVARCAVAGRDLGAMMVRYGVAVEYRYFSKGAYRSLEREAQAEHVGLWHEDNRFIDPWKWRREHASK